MSDEMDDLPLALDTAVDRHHTCRKDHPALPFIEFGQITSWIMAVCALYFALIAFYPSLALIVPVILIYAAAFGAYQAVDWALALKVLPSAEEAGKDMGIWRISMVLPQILGRRSREDDIGGEGILRRSHCIRDSIRDWSALAHALGGSRHPRVGNGPCRKIKFEHTDRVIRRV